MNSDSISHDMGMSYSAKKPVMEKLSEGFVGTLLLAFVTIIFVLLISLPLGIWSAVKQNQLPDYFVRICSFIGVSMPNFWLGLILLYIFGLKLGWFPIRNYFACDNACNLSINKICQTGSHGNFGRTASRLCYRRKSARLERGGNFVETYFAERNFAFDNFAGNVNRLVTWWRGSY